MATDTSNCHTNLYIWKTEIGNEHYTMYNYCTKTVPAFSDCNIAVYISLVDRPILLLASSPGS